jgi:hypothetical protein
MRKGALLLLILFMIPTAAAFNNTVFITNAVQSGNMGGLSGADTICQNAANSAGLDGTYKAWLSDNANSPNTRFVQADIPYVKTNNVVIAQNYSDLVDGTIDSPINYDENGDFRSGEFNQVATNTRDNGNVYLTDSQNGHCNKWTSTSGGLIRAIGHYNLVTEWSLDGTSPNSNCGSANDRPIYCFGQSTSSDLLPSYGNFSVPLGTTNFSNEGNLNSVSSMSLATSQGKITWQSSVDVAGENLDEDVIIGSGFVSVNVSGLVNPTGGMNSTADVSVQVADCGTWTIYHSTIPVSSLTQLKNIGTVVGSGSGETGSCTTYCSNPVCSNGQLNFTVAHFDGAGGEGSGAVPEFSTWAMLIALSGVLVGFFTIRKNK